MDASPPASLGTSLRLLHRALRQQMDPPVVYFPLCLHDRSLPLSWPRGEESFEWWKGNVAMKLAAEIADGANAELLSEFIGRRLKFHDDGVKVTDNSGNLTVSSLSDLKTEFQNDARYSALLKGNQSSGL